MWILVVTRIEYTPVKSQLLAAEISVKNYSEFEWNFSVSLDIEGPKLESTFVTLWWHYSCYSDKNNTNAKKISLSSPEPGKAREAGEGQWSKFKCLLSSDHAILDLVTAGGQSLWGEWSKN